MRSGKIKKKQVLWLIFLLALVLRFGVGWTAYKKHVMANFSDDKAYMEFAQQISEQGPLVPEIWKLSKTAQVVGPGLPWIMALTMNIFPGGWLSIFILNALIGAITCILIYLLGKELFNENVGLYGAFWAAFYVLFLKYIATAGKEVWLTFIFTAILFVMLKITGRDAEKNYRYTYIILLAVFFSLLIHVDERYFAYFPLMGVGLLWLDWPGRKQWWAGLKKMVLFFILVLVFMLPWLIRNYSVYHKPVILSPRTTPFTDWIFGYKPEKYSESVENRWYLSDPQIEMARQGIPVKRKDGKEITSDQQQAMKDGILPHRFSKLESAWSVFQVLWKPVDFNRGYSTTGYRYDGTWSLRHNLGVGLTYGLLLPFFLYGIIHLFGHRRKIAAFLASILLFHTLIHVLFIPFTRNRYRIPIDPIIIILGISGALTLVETLKGKYLKSKYLTSNPDKG